MEHEHPLLKIKYVHQKPLKLIAVIDDDHESVEINGNKFEIPGLNHGLNFFGNMMNGPCGDRFKNMANKFKDHCQKFKECQKPKE